jgi:hypothetical protein
MKKMKMRMMMAEQIDKRNVEVLPTVTVVAVVAVVAVAVVDTFAVVVVVQGVVVVVVAVAVDTFVVDTFVVDTFVVVVVVQGVVAVVAVDTFVVDTFVVDKQDPSQVEEEVDKTGQVHHCRGSYRVVLLPLGPVVVLYYQVPYPPSSAQPFVTMVCLSPVILVLRALERVLLLS